jgi:hypothetical protein
MKYTAVSLAEFIEQRKKENPPDFSTHANYIEFLCSFSKNMTLEFHQKITNKIKSPSGLIKQKARLIDSTIKSIQEEGKIIAENIGFARVCCSWIPVKSYYIIFNSLLILKYLITCDEKAFSSGHTELNNDFKGYLGKGELKFSQDFFNKVYTGKGIETMSAWTSPSGESLKKGDFVKDFRYNHIVKKIIDYRKEEFRRVKGRSISGRHKVEFLKGRVCLSDFFYCWRIKANYGGMEFLDKDIPDYKFRDYYNNYVEFTANYFECLKKVINELAVIRIGEKVL